MNRRLLRCCLHLVIILNDFCTVLPFLAFWQPICEADDSNFFNVIEKLHETLLKKYDKQIRPVINQAETLHVEAVLRLINFNYDELNARFSATGWFHMSWIDPRLKWSPSDYDGLKSIHVPSSEVWLPDLEVYYTSPVSASVDRSLPTYTAVLILSDGTVSFFPHCNLVSVCVSNSTLYPFDEVTCKVVVGSWTHNTVKMNITLWDDKVFTYDLTSPTISQWNLTKTDASIEVVTYESVDPDSPNHYQTIKYSFTLKRYLSTLNAITTPAIMIMILSLTTFLIPPGLSAKLHVGVINIAIICAFLLYFHTTLPSENASTPLIVSFYSDSLILVTISILSSVYFLCCMRSSKPSPHPILIRFILKSRLGRILGVSQVQRNDNQEIKRTNQVCLDNNDFETQQWMNLCLAFDRVTFIIYCLIIVFIFAAYLVG